MKTPSLFLVILLHSVPPRDSGYLQLARTFHLGDRGVMRLRKATNNGVTWTYLWVRIIARMAIQQVVCSAIQFMIPEMASVE
jgi:hypothetical protein